ncbi:MAG: selenium-dependent xanthine dehydrogenase [Candidatus Metalachnospira sp.]|nr:selenium-dependent xanthine dehydrogenase [Candidatus Metalachnospira sp.]
MSTFTVNGITYTITDNIKLMPFLRDTLKLTSVKNGCNEGACGTCTVIIDSKAAKACVQKIDNLNGKTIITTEGLSDREKSVYSYAFSESGAVQCGFCIPGMVMCAKALIDKNPSPSFEDVKTAIKNNICRCTGYKKIEDAILLAAKIFRENTEITKPVYTGLLGESMHRVDAYDKALGSAKYADDYYLDGMIYGSALRSEYPRAKVLSIDVSQAKSMEGVIAIMTANDIPGTQKVGHLKRDWDVLIPVGKITHYLGDAIALVAAETPEIMEEAKKKIKVEYEPLDGVFSPADSMKENATLVHHDGNLLASEHLVRGNADEVISNSKYSVTYHYSVPFTEHAFMEPECAVAYPEDSGIHIISGDQGVYQTQRECSDALGLPIEKVRVSAAMVGGGFGGKEDMSVQHHAALLAQATNRPVKVKLTRAESILVHPKRHAMEMDFTTACDENGYLTAMKAVIISDTGAYASLGGPVLQRACTHAAGPYNYQVIDIMGKAYYTNNPPAGAFRGFGVTQSCFATECNLNKLAEKVGITPFEIRYRNAIRPGQILPNGQIADETTALVETLDAVRDIYENNPKCGIACALKNSGLGVGIPDTGRCLITIRNGKVYVTSSAACIGQGMGTIQIQMICETTGISPDNIIYEAPDTSISPNAGNTTASRQTLFTGEAAARASRMLKQALVKEGTLSALEGQSYLGEYTGITDKLGSDKPNPVSHIAYGYATHVVELNEDGTLKCVTAVHDVGNPVNPKSLEGQIEGGVTMSLGYALTEDYPLVNGKPLAKFGTLGLFRADKTPYIKSVIVGKKIRGLAYGAKGIGEIASIPTAPAVQLAYYNYDGIFRTELPLKGTVYKK